ncbi:adenylyltransferase and sulfurtransferase [Pseudobutyrivibrio sp. YE44]|uniref:ThiF family adenylyltransferase n=1 Tax=Pseudobutyrivibrio sp. YE44 TaxID=1520802 RepID=UPI0008921CDE|nr:ThiF family adenylyltransferase [Pseudobutyrivibrio sp. YE44]SDB14461.1 adenylyltransferase and sulfurtransferase [Pseudobutyrivibrio sp. YE44]
MKVYISATLRTFFDKTAQTEIEGKTVGEILKGLTDEYPESKKGLYDDDGKLRSFIRIFVNDEDFTDVSRHKEKLSENSEVLLLPLIAGGKPSDSIISDERQKEISIDEKGIERFNKHLMLREISVKGQKRIKAAKVVVIGAGALGSAAIQYLAAAGVGTIKVIDHDKVELGNLQSQVIHGARDVNRPKVASARDTIRNIDRSIEVIDENQQLTAENAIDLIDGFDLVLDCTDNYKARYLINDACILAGIPLVFASIYQYEGLVSVFNYKGGPCLRCLFPAPPSPGLVPTCTEGGSISPLGGIIGSIQANEALKLIIGIGEHLDGKLLTFDSLNLKSRVVNIDKDCDCPICGLNKTITEIVDFDYEDFCGLKEDETEIPVEGFTADEFAKRLEEEVPMTIIDVREPHERAILRFPGAVVIPIGQLARRQKELNPDIDTVFICKEGKRSILAINTLREAGYEGPLYNLKGGIEGMKDIIFSHEAGLL